MRKGQAAAGPRPHHRAEPLIIDDERRLEGHGRETLEKLGEVAITASWISDELFLGWPLPLMRTT